MREPIPLDGQPVVVIISRDEVEARDTSSVIQILESCLSSPENARLYFERIDIAFHGYDQDTRELFEIPEVRGYVSLLDDKFPYWLFFLTKTGLGLQCGTLCLMPPYLSKEGRETVLPERLNKLLNNRWFPAMIHICEAVGYSEQRIEKLTDEVVNYFQAGPQGRLTRS